MVEVNTDGETHYKRLFDDERPTHGGTPTRTVAKSTSDPELKGDYRKQFAYEVHTACDECGLVIF